jgi:hypothetical protein
MRTPVKREHKLSKKKRISKRLERAGMTGLRDLARIGIIKLNRDGTYHVLNAHPPGKEVSERLGISEYDIKKVDKYLEQAFADYLYNRGLRGPECLYRATQSYIALLKTEKVYKKMAKIVKWGIKEKNNS